jgi:hypothetical protein
MAADKGKRMVSELYECRRIREDAFSEYLQ